MNTALTLRDARHLRLIRGFWVKPSEMAPNPNIGRDPNTFQLGRFRLEWRNR